jgi:lysylphosphatidylglycerol synthetase-like protein (DUF2156 family)
MRQRSTLSNILLLVLVLIVGGFFLSLFVSVLSGILWFAIKVLIPIAIIVWLVRLITGRSNNNRRYY